MIRNPTGGNTFGLQLGSAGVGRIVEGPVAEVAGNHQSQSQALAFGLLLIALAAGSQGQNKSKT